MRAVLQHSIRLEHGEPFSGRHIMSNEADAADADLQEWLDGVLHGEWSDEDGGNAFMLPSDEAADLLVSRFSGMEDADARTILRSLLIHNGSLGADARHLRWLRSQQGSLPRLEYERRLLDFDPRRVGSIPPWEGITWVLDLLPRWPEVALSAVSGYVLAHAQVLPDGRYTGLHDAMALIRVRYVGVPGSNPEERRRSLLRLSPREFERLIERYLNGQDYRTSLTTPTQDGGRDVVADRTDPPPRQNIHAECKNWSTRVGRPVAQRLLGVLSDAKGTTGLLVATSGFTGPAEQFAVDNPRLTLLGGDRLVSELDRVLGWSWPTRIDSLLLESERHVP